MTQPRRIALVGVVVLALAFAYFIWPTPYQYIDVAAGVKDGQYVVTSARVNRFTGRTEWLLFPVGWVPASQ